MCLRSRGGRKIKTAMFQYLITMAATVIFDLTVAIIIGILFSVIMFVLKVSDMTVNVADVDPAKIDIADKDGKLCGTKVVYVTGPLYFGDNITQHYFIRPRFITVVTATAVGRYRAIHGVTAFRLRRCAVAVARCE